MSHVHEGPLASYNSLTDGHLAGYFANNRMRRHLQRAGLISRRGEIVSEATYRLNMSRREHKKHVKDMLAQAIVHKSLDLERAHQAEIKKKLEEIAKIQLVRRVREERSKVYEESLFPLLSARSNHTRTPSPRHTRPKQPSLPQSTNSIPSQQDRASTGKKGDEDILPLLTPKSSRYDPVCSKRRGGQKKHGHGGVPGVRAESGLSLLSLEEEGDVLYLDDEGRPITPAERPAEQNQIDTRQLHSLDTAALRKYAMLMSQMEEGRGLTSPYMMPQVPLPPQPPSTGRTPRSARRVQSASPRRTVTTDTRLARLHRPETAKSHVGDQQTLCRVMMKYHGWALNLAREKIDNTQEVLIEQQHCGGNTLTVFRERLVPGTSFEFISYRHRGYPFSLSLYVDGQMDSRVSTCCEYRHSRGAKIGGKQGHFSLLRVSGAVPCYKCQVAKGVLVRSKAKPRKPKRPAEPHKEEVIIVATKSDQRDGLDQRSGAEPEEVEKGQEEVVMVPVEGEERDTDESKLRSSRTVTDASYDDDFEDSRSSASSKSSKSSSSSESESESDSELSTPKGEDYTVSVRNKERGQDVQHGHRLPVDESSSNSLLQRATRLRPKSAPKGRLSQRAQMDNHSPERAPFTDTVTPCQSLSSTTSSSSLSSSSSSSSSSSTPEAEKPRPKKKLKTSPVKTKPTASANITSPDDVPASANIEVRPDGVPASANIEVRPDDVPVTTQGPEEAKPLKAEAQSMEWNQIRPLSKTEDIQHNTLAVEEDRKKEERQFQVEFKKSREEKRTSSSSVVAQATNVDLKPVEQKDSLHEMDSKTRPDKQNLQPKEEADTADEVSEIESEVVSPRRLDTNIHLDMVEKVTGPDFSGHCRMSVSTRLVGRQAGDKCLSDLSEDKEEEEAQSRGEEDTNNMYNTLGVEPRGSEERTSRGMDTITCTQHEAGKRKRIPYDTRGKTQSHPKTKTVFISNTSESQKVRHKNHCKDSSSSISFSSSSSSDSSYTSTSCSSTTGSQSEVYSPVALTDERASLIEEQEGFNGYALKGSQKEKIIKKPIKKQDKKVSEKSTDRTTGAVVEEEMKKILKGPQIIVPPSDYDASRGEEEIESEDNGAERRDTPGERPWTAQSTDRAQHEDAERQKSSEQILQATSSKGRDGVVLKEPESPLTNKDPPDSASEEDGTFDSLEQREEGAEQREEGPEHVEKMPKIVISPIGESNLILGVIKADSCVHSEEHSTVSEGTDSRLRTGEANRQQVPENSVFQEKADDAFDAELKEAPEHSQTALTTDSQNITNEADVPDKREPAIDLVFCEPDSPAAGDNAAESPHPEISIAVVRRLSAELGMDVEKVVMDQLRRQSTEGEDNDKERTPCANISGGGASPRQRKLSADPDSGDDSIESLYRNLGRRRSSLTVPVVTEALQLTDRWVTEEDLTKQTPEQKENENRSKTERETENNTTASEVAEEDTVEFAEAKDKDVTGCEIEKDGMKDIGEEMLAKEGATRLGDEEKPAGTALANSNNHCPVSTAEDETLSPDCSPRLVIDTKERGDMISASSSSLSSSSSDSTITSTSQSSTASSNDDRYVTKSDQSDRGGRSPCDISSPLPATPEEMLRKQEAMRAGQSTPLPPGGALREEELEALKEEVERDVSRPQDPVTNVNITLPVSDHTDLYVIHESENETSEVDRSGASRKEDLEMGKVTGDRKESAEEEEREQKEGERQEGEVHLQPTEPPGKERQDRGHTFTPSPRQDTSTHSPRVEINGTGREIDDYSSDEEDGSKVKVISMEEVEAEPAPIKSRRYSSSSSSSSSDTKEERQEPSNALTINVELLDKEEKEQEDARRDRKRRHEVRQREEQEHYQKLQQEREQRREEQRRAREERRQADLLRQQQRDEERRKREEQRRQEEETERRRREEEEEERQRQAALLQDNPEVREAERLKSQRLREAQILEEQIRREEKRREEEEARDRAWQEEQRKREEERRKISEEREKRRQEEGSSTTRSDYSTTVSGTSTTLSQDSSAASTPRGALPGPLTTEAEDPDRMRAASPFPEAAIYHDRQRLRDRRDDGPPPRAASPLPPPAIYLDRRQNRREQDGDTTPPRSVSPFPSPAVYVDGRKARRQKEMVSDDDDEPAAAVYDAGQQSVPSGPVPRIGLTAPSPTSDPDRQDTARSSANEGTVSTARSTSTFTETSEDERDEPGQTGYQASFNTRQQQGRRSGTEDSSSDSDTTTTGSDSHRSNTTDSATARDTAGLQEGSGQERTEGGEGPAAVHVTSESDGENMHGGADPDKVAEEETEGELRPLKMGTAPKARPHQGKVSELLAPDTDSVELANILLTKSQVYEVAALLETSERVKMISLCNTGLDDNDLQRLTEAIAASASEPMMLNLSLNCVTQQGVTHILTVLKAKPSIKLLIVQSNPIGDEGITQLIQGLKDLHRQARANRKALPQDLSTSDTASVDSSASSIDPAALAGRYLLQELDLTDTKLGDRGAGQVADLIATNVYVENLCLSHNQDITATQGWTHIGNALRHNRCLRSLTLDGNKIGDEGMYHLASGLQSNRVLKSLSLEDAGIGAEGGKSILQMLRKNTSILELTLSPGNSVSEEHAEEIAKYITLNRTPYNVLGI